jgi:hypothetical protein
MQYTTTKQKWLKNNKNIYQNNLTCISAPVIIVVNKTVLHTFAVILSFLGIRNSFNSFKEYLHTISTDC